MPPKSVAVVAALLVAACSSGDDDGDATPATAGGAGCPVAATVVAEAVGHAVAVERGAPGDGSCTYLGEGGSAAGAHVEIAVRSLAEQGFAEVLADVERRTGPTVALDDGDVDGADRGWVAAVGRAVQLGAAGGERLVLVAVADPLLDAEAARDVAARLAGEILG